MLSVRLHKVKKVFWRNYTVACWIDIWVDEVYVTHLQNRYTTQDLPHSHRSDIHKLLLLNAPVGLNHQCSCSFVPWLNKKREKKERTLLKLNKDPEASSDMPDLTSENSRDEMGVKRKTAHYKHFRWFVMSYTYWTYYITTNIQNSSQFSYMSMFYTATL